jgi:hypothetical protein
MPRRWRNLDKRTAPPFIVRTAGCRGGLGGNGVKNFIFFGENFAKQNSLERAN